LIQFSRFFVSSRLPDVAEALDHGLVEDVRGWGGRRFEDPAETLLKMLDEPRFKGKALGIEWPAHYVSVANYRKLSAALGEKLKDATTLIESSRTCSSYRFAVSSRLPCR
jgi:Xaa-Pro dipeptidase